jgi:hypothetical protein
LSQGLSGSALNTCLTNTLGISGTSTATAGATGTSSSTTTTQTSSSTTGTVTSDQIAQFNTYKPIFDKYSQQNAPSSTRFTSISQSDFEALLVAIAQYCNWGNLGTVTGNNGDWLMCYQTGNSVYQGADLQVSTVSGILGSVLSQQISSPSSAYNSCISTTVINDQLSCILSVLDTGKTNSNGFLGIGANTVGINYANSVLTLWNNWKTYFNSQNSVTANSLAQLTS